MIGRVLRITPESGLIAELSVTALRVFAGLSMAFAHGIGKLPPGEQLIGGVTAMGFPAPVAFAWAAALSEFLGGLLLAVGLFTRFGALAVAGTMVVAAFGAHAADPFRAKELALLYLTIAVVFTVRGAGRFSVDRFIGR